MSKMDRKRAEEDAKILANRIALLKLEEQKTWKKIEETKNKARQVIQQRKRNEELQRQKQQRQKEKVDEEQRLLLKNKMQKDQLRDGIKYHKEALALKKDEET